MESIKVFEAIHLPKKKKKKISFFPIPKSHGVS